jgi:radical SAM superfamily enzyme YgiQ (UPF0313 family)
MNRRRVLLVQLPIPPVGPQPIRGNVPLAAGYLILYARRRGLERDFDFAILPPTVANTSSDLGVVEAILAENPSVVGFSCYLWNIDRTLWIAERLKAARPDLLIVLGGPEISGDNAWVLDHPAADVAVIGEGEQTFADLLIQLRDDGKPRPGPPGLYVRGRSLGPPPFRHPLPSLDEVSSPYLEGILDAADEQLLLLETIRGCIFKCKFCYYPKSYDGLYFVPEEKVVANLRHAAERGVSEVVLLDPTLNQRKDFHGFLKLLAKCNPNHQWTYFGELRGEGIKPETAQLLRAANFTEVEVGLQSIDPRAQELMDRKNGVKAFERGATAMMDAGLKVKVDLIIGLPGDTAASVREGLRYLHRAGLYHDVQVFQLSVLPGTAFRQEAAELGLRYQPRPPYYVLETPTMSLAEMADLMAEAQELFQCEFDAPAPPRLTFQKPERSAPVDLIAVDFEKERSPLPPPERRAQALTLWLKADEFNGLTERAAAVAATLLRDNPHTTLQVVFEPRSGVQGITPAVLEAVQAATLKSPSYLDRFYAFQPGRARGAKRLVVLAPVAERSAVDPTTLESLGAFATIVWTGVDDSADLDLAEFEEAAVSNGG